MSRVLNRPLGEIRQEFGLPMLPGRAVSTVLHEAAHATVALAHGVEVTGVWVRANGNVRIGANWYGNCDYRDTFTSAAAESEFAVAGLAAASFSHPEIDNNWVAGADGDVLSLVDLGIDREKARDILDAAIARLRANQGVFDRIASELLTMRSDYQMGTLSESEIRSIANPGMRPDPDTPLRDWTRAQRCRLADDIEAMARNGSLPPTLRTLLDEATQSRQPENGSTGSTGLPGTVQFSAPISIAPTSPGGYEHRMLRGAR